MSHEHSQCAEVRDICSAALARMEELDIPATPENYTVWYAYCAGTHDELVRVLDVLISNKTSFTPERNAEVYERFFGTAGHTRAVVNAGRQIEAVMNRVATLLGQAGEDTNSYGRALADLSGGLAEDHSLENVQSTVKALMRETRAILIKNRELEHRLDRSKREVTELRRDLETVRRDAVTDSLTGIANRKLFDQRLREGSAGAMENGSGLCLVLLDIDHFKAFNDRYGHHIGDEVLKLVAKHLCDYVKGRDTPARYGGEEFALILPDTRLDDAELLADRIRARLARHTLTSRKTDTRYGRVTISVGVAEYRYGEPMERLIQRADAALYAAKAAGRNRVCTEVAVDAAPASNGSIAASTQLPG